MPLIKREVEPILVSQVDIDKSIKDELECVSNYTLASIIRQLGNLGKHAEDIFGDLFQEASGLAQRATNIQNRMEKINNYLNKLDPLKDSVSMRDINSRIAFTSSMKMEKEVVSSPTMPSAMKDTYNRCQQTPPLSKLSKYREDGKDALKFYTDPKFFFERWLYEQHKDIDKKKKKKKKRPQSKLAEGKPKKVITRKEKFKELGKGKELMEIEKERERAAAEEQKKTSMDNGQQSEPMDTTPSTTDSPKKSTPSRRAPAPPGPPNSSMLPPPPPPPAMQNGSGATTSVDLPPPPPPDMMEGAYASIPNGDGGSAPTPPPPPPPPPPGPGVPAAPPPPGAPPAPAPPPLGGPAPPPPPPVPTGTGPGAPPPPPVPSMADAKAALKSATNRTSRAPAIVDTRDTLLSAIRDGMQLRKVDKTVKQQQIEPQDNSVEAILRRRIALELSDDEEDESTYDSDEDEWSD